MFQDDLRRADRFVVRLAVPIGPHGGPYEDRASGAPRGTMVRRMPTSARLMVTVLMSLACIAVIGICAIGFLGTLEPLDPARQWVWRLIYGGIALVVLVLTIWLGRLLWRTG
jgi:hypothetical protein